MGWKGDRPEFEFHQEARARAQAVALATALYLTLTDEAVTQAFHRNFLFASSAYAGLQDFISDGSRRLTERLGPALVDSSDPTARSSVGAETRARQAREEVQRTRENLRSFVDDIIQEAEPDDSNFLSIEEAQDVMDEANERRMNAQDELLRRAGDLYETLRATHGLPPMALLVLPPAERSSSSYESRRRQRDMDQMLAAIESISFADIDLDTGAWPPTVRPAERERVQSSRESSASESEQPASEYEQLLRRVIDEMSRGYDPDELRSFQDLLEVAQGSQPDLFVRLRDLTSPRFRMTWRRKEEILAVLKRALPPDRLSQAPSRDRTPQAPTITDNDPELDPKARIERRAAARRAAAHGRFPPAKRSRFRVLREATLETVRLKVCPLFPFCE